MRMLKAPCALAMLAMLICFNSVDRPIAQGQGYLLKEKLEVGSVRMVQATRAIDSAITLSPGTAYATTSNIEIARTSIIHEWITGMNDGRVTEVWRSYPVIDAKQTNTVDYGTGPQQVESPIVDLKKQQTFIMRVAADGTREITHATWDFIGTSDRAYVQLDKDIDLLPGRAAKVGESWNIDASKLGLVAMATPADKITDCDFKVTFNSVKTDDAGNQYADLGVKATISVSNKTPSALGDQYATDLAATSTFEGSALFNISAGQMTSYEWSGSSSVAGRMNGGPVSAEADFTESNAYGYGFVNDRAVDNGDNAPTEAKEMQVPKTGAVDPAHIVIARNNNKRSLIQEFDPATRKIVRTLATLPAGVSVSNLALSPDRKRIAFSSNLNALISLAKSNVFVLELTTGELNQISPEWADNKGIAKPLTTAKTATITGRIVWHDNDPQGQRDRNDGFIGAARIDHTPCIGLIRPDGTFTVTGVPVGIPLLFDISGMIPNNFADGKPRPAGTRYAGATMAALTLPEDGKNLGDVRVTSGHAETVYDRPSWQGDTLWFNMSAWTMAYKTGYPAHSWASTTFGQLEILWGGFSVNDKYVAFCQDSSGGHSAVRFFTRDGKLVWGAEVPGIKFDFTAEGAWAGDGGWVGCARIDNTLGMDLYGSPALVYANPTTKQASGVRIWPQLAGHKMISLATDKDARYGFFVTHKYVKQTNLTLGDAWVWDSATDRLTRLTSLNDVVAIADYGR